MICLLQTASWRGLHVDEHRPHVLIGHQTCLRHAHHPHQGDDREHDKPNGEPSTGDEYGHSALITAEDGVETIIEALEDAR